MIRRDLAMLLAGAVLGVSVSLVAVLVLLH
jgi:hypothetical protein